MIRIFSALLFVLCIVTACKKESAAPETPLTENADSSSVLSLSGSFMDGPYGAVTGNAKIFQSDMGSQVLLDSFLTSNGPDLYVYLSKQIMPVNFVSLGKLKSTTGSQVYDIPAGTNIADYKYVCIHCQQYNHLFGYALIQ